MPLNPVAFDRRSTETRTAGSRRGVQALLRSDSGESGYSLPSATVRWRERVAEARARRWFTNAEINRASDWHTCAVGEQRRLTPLVVRIAATSGSPMDAQLFDFGGQFATAVYEQDFDRADYLLDMIEDRVSWMKRFLG